MLLAQGEEGLGAAAVLRRGAAGSAAAPRVAPAWASRLDGLNAQVVPPGAQVGEERVVVGEALAHPQPETAQPDGVRVLGGPEALPVTGGILGAADSEACRCSPLQQNAACTRRCSSASVVAAVTSSCRQISGLMPASITRSR